MADFPKDVFLVYNQFVYPITKPRTRIGRHDDNDLVLQETSISRYHAEIHYTGKDFILHDMGSANGTKVNDAAVNEWVLTPGTLFHLADVKLVFVKDDKRVTNSLKSDTGELK